MAQIYIGIENLCPECAGGACHVIRCDECGQVFERHLSTSRQLEVSDEVMRGHVCADE